MSQLRSSTGIFLIVLLAVIGYVLWTMPHQLVDGWTKAHELSPWAGYLYLVVVGVGGLLLASLLIAILVHIWKNTRQKTADDRRRNLNPSQMSAAERKEELADNL